MLAKFMQDPQSNTLAVIVLVALAGCWITSFALVLKDVSLEGKKWYAWGLSGLTLLAVPALLDILQTSDIALVFATIASLALALNVIVPLLADRSSHPLVKDWLKWAIPVLVIAGLAVAGYLTFVESMNRPVMCGQAKGCDDVQNSPYATLFGILPVGMFGLAGYLAILAGWLVWQYGPAFLKKPGALFIWGCCIFGVIFSTYLTFLEPFVIGATCMWCITSAVLMILLLWVTTPAAQKALTISEE